MSLRTVVIAGLARLVGANFEFTDHEEANDYLHREYREGWMV